MPYMFTPEQFDESLRTVRNLALDLGRGHNAVQGALFAFLTVDRDGARARRVSIETVSGYYKQDFQRHQRYLVAGTPGECSARLREYQEAGASSIQLNIACPDDEEEAMLRLVVEEILPAFRA